jgi:3-isopropylmalate dehydrogenase
MLDHLGRSAEAASIERAVQGCVEAERCTADVGGTLSTPQAGDAVVERLEL